MLGHTVKLDSKSIGVDSKRHFVAQRKVVISCIVCVVDNIARTSQSKEMHHACERCTLTHVNAHAVAPATMRVGVNVMW